MADTFTLRAALRSDSAAGSALLSQVANDILAWLDERTYRNHGLRIGISGHREIGQWPANADGRSVVRIDGQDLPAKSAEFWRLRWDQPDPAVPPRPVRWTTDVRLSALGEALELDVQIRVVADGTALVQSYPDVSPPNFVAPLLEKYYASIDGWRVDAQSTCISPATIEGFVKHTLLNPSRRLPLIILSLGANDRYLVDPDNLASLLAGVAGVAHIDAYQTNWQWTELVGGKLQSVFRGAVREYWPGFTVGTEDIGAHRLWLPQRIQEMGGHFRWFLFHRLTQLAGRYFDGMRTLWQQVQALVEQERREQLTTLAGRIADSEAATELVDLASRQLDDARKERDDALAENDKLHRRIADIGAELAEQRRQWFITKPFSNIVATEADSPVVANVFDAVNLAEKQLSHLRFLQSAKRSAKDSLYAEPGTVLEALQQLDEVGSLRAKGSSLGMSLRDWLAERGVDYVAHESQTTMSRYGESREFKDGELTREMKEHVRFGIGQDSTKCLRLHLQWDETEKQWVVGWVGEHRPNVSKN